MIRNEGCVIFAFMPIIDTIQTMSSSLRRNGRGSCSLLCSPSLRLQPAADSADAWVQELCQELDGNSILQAEPALK